MNNAIIRNGRIVIPRCNKLLPLLLEYLWAVMLVLNGNSVYHASSIQDYHLLEKCLILTYLLLAVYLFQKRIRLYSNDLIVSVGLALYSVIYLCAQQGDMSSSDFAMLFIMGLPGLYLLFCQMRREGMLLSLMHKVENIICILAAISLFFWVFGVVLELIQPNMGLYISWGRFTWAEGFFGMHFKVQLDTTFFKDQFLYRNSSIFAEAPMLNLWLNFSLAIELFMREKTSRVRITLLVITIFTTMSLTGFFFLALCLLLNLLRDHHAMSRKRRSFMVALIVVLVFPALIVVIAYSMSMKSETQSYLMRLTDYLSGIRLWADHPIFGSGYGNLRSIMAYSYSPNGILGFSNSLTAVLGTGGLWMAMLFYLPHFGAISQRWSGSKRLSCFAICNLFLFSTTAYFGRYLAVVMIALELALLQRPWNETCPSPDSAREEMRK